MKINIGKFPKKSSGKRKINIEIDNYDTWNLDHTLALIIYPALLSLKQLSRAYQVNLPMLVARVMGRKIVLISTKKHMKMPGKMD